MLTFDKLKLVAPIDYVEDIDPSKFSRVIENGHTTKLKLKITEPFCLSIEIKYDCREVCVEFSGKVLGPEYRQLISIQTIEKCFARINNLGFCFFDPGKMMTAEVVQCDVTKDVYIDDVPMMTKWIIANISSSQRYICKRFHSNGNLTISTNVAKKKNERRMTIYDKELEMAKKTEQTFVTENDLRGVFDGLCRFELNLCSKKQIRDTLHTSGNSLQEVLLSDSNPLSDYLEKALTKEPVNERHYSGKNGMYKHMMQLVLKECDYDINKVDALLRLYYNPSKTSIPNKVKPFEALLKEPTSKTILREDIINAVSMTGPATSCQLRQ